MNVFRVIFEVCGGHVHCALFVAPSERHTFAKCGSFVVSKGHEFADLMEAFKGADFKGRTDSEPSTIEAASTP